MTDSRDDASSTRPISVAELLAKNGTIGAPPVGGRRRRRRGNADAVTVAELTGEIPIITDDSTTGRVPVQRRPQPPEPVVEEPTPEPVPEPAAEQVDESTADVEPEPDVEPDLEPELVAEPESDVVAEPEPELVAEPESDVVAEPEPVLSEAEADYAAHLEQRNADPSPLDFAAPPRRPQSARFPTASPTTSSTTASSAQPTVFATQGSGAEQMSPDPVVDDDDELLDLGPDVDFDGVFDKRAGADDDDADVRDAEPSYLRSGADTLFGGQSVADDLARRGPRSASEDADAGDTATDAKATPAAGGSAFVRGLWVVAQCVLAVAFGAGLFIAFDQLWRWNTIVALVLSVLVILGLVVGVRVVRKTEDIGSTLIAVAVGALVTLGPLALLQSH